MAGSFSDYAENKILDHAMGDTSWTMPSALYAALVTVTPTDAMTGGTITEATYTGYARVQVTAANLNAASGGSKTTSLDITFGACTGGSSAVVGVVLLDASTSGNSILYSTITSKTIDTSNTPPTIKAGQLTATLD